MTDNESHVGNVVVTCLNAKHKDIRNILKPASLRRAEVH